MFNAIRRLFTAITTATVVKLTADVMELEKRVEHEFNFGCKMAARYSEVSYELSKTRQQLIEARECIAKRDEEITIAHASYRSLLRDYQDQQEQLDKVTRENQKLKKANECLGMTNVFLEHELEQTKVLCVSLNTEVERLKRENEYLKQQLFESLDLTSRYSDLADTYRVSYEKTVEELDLALSRQQLYRECLHDRG